MKVWALWVSYDDDYGEDTLIREAYPTKALAVNAAVEYLKNQVMGEDYDWEEDKPQVWSERVTYYDAAIELIPLDVKLPRQPKDM